MITNRRIEKQWLGRQYQTLTRELLVGRVESALADDIVAAGSLAAAALALIRIDELNQSHLPIAGKLIRAILAAQHTDGGWGELIPTALSLRALSIDQGHGLAIENGMRWLSTLQQVDGIWPRIPLRRMPADATVSAFVLISLGNNPAFHRAVRVDDALNWFARNDESLDKLTRRLCSHARLRCTMPASVSAETDQAWMWS